MAPIKLTTLQNYHDEFGNEIEYAGAHVTNEVEIVFNGKGNRLVIEPDAKLGKIVAEFKGDNAEVSIGACNARCAIYLGSNSKISIGRGLSTTAAVYMTAFEGSDIHIGRDCMFAGGVSIRADDAHPIFDVESGERVNKAKSILIGEHVWLGAGCTILGGTEIGAGSVVGTGAIVKAKTPNNCVVVGNPAKVVRKNIAWARPHLSRESMYQPDGTLKEANKEHWNFTDEF